MANMNTKSQLAGAQLTAPDSAAPAAQPTEAFPTTTTNRQSLLLGIPWKGGTIYLNSRHC